MSRTDKDQHWSRRDWGRPMGGWAIHLALSHSRPVDRREYWWGPDRARTLKELTEARKEYRGTGDVLLEPTVRQHRHDTDWLMS